jgi:hypothetical protein
MIPPPLSKGSKSLLALAILGATLIALPQSAHAFLGGSSSKTELLTGAIDSVAAQTGRKVIVLDKKGAVVTSTCEKECAKTKPAGKGHIYVNNLKTGALYPEIRQTLSDGKTRVFSATGPDGKAFKKSITAILSHGQVIGAVLVITPLKS